MEAGFVSDGKVIGRGTLKVVSSGADCGCLSATIASYENGALRTNVTYLPLPGSEKMGGPSQWFRRCH